MRRYVHSTIDVVLDRTADELIGGLLVALLLALALAGAFALLHRRVRDTTTLIAVLALVANLAGMIVAAGFVRRAYSQDMRSNAEPSRGLPLVAADRGAALARIIFERADHNHDGVLSPGEAAREAEGFVTRTERREGGELNEGLLRSALRRHMLPPELAAPVPPGVPARAATRPPGPAATPAPAPTTEPPGRAP